MDDVSSGKRLEDLARSYGLGVASEHVPVTGEIDSGVGPGWPCGLPDGFRFYDLRHTGHTLSTRSGATLKDTMVRAYQSSEKAARIYQHSDGERQRDVAAGLDDLVRAERAKRCKPGQQ